MSKGVSYSQSLQSYATTLQSLGFDFVMRCYSVADPAKNLTADEVKILSNAGLGIVSYWGDGTANSALYFTYENGLHDGLNALACATAASQDTGTPIFFPVGYDASAEDVIGAIINYFYGVQRAITSTDGNPLYEIGICGSGLVCSTFLNYFNNPGVDVAGSADIYTWMADMPGWNNNNFTSYNVRQYLWQLSYPSEKLAFDVNFAPNDDPGSFPLS